MIDGWLSFSSYQKMLFTLEQCDYSFQKTQLILEMNKAEMDRYSVLNSEIGLFTVGPCGIQ